MKLKLENLIASSVVVGIVEDDNDVIHYLTRAFSNEMSLRHDVDFQVFTTNDFKVAEGWALADTIDIYLIDLGLPEVSKGSEPDWHNGRNLIRHIHSITTAGIIVYTSEHLAQRAQELLSCGADDFIRKAEVLSEFGEAMEDMQSYIRAKVLSVWRRTRLSRPAHKTLIRHIDRSFQLGKWLFAIESRAIESGGKNQKLTASEHAVLRHLCISEEHSINQSEFQGFITGQTIDTEDVRLKNLIYRLRQKLGPSVDIVNSDSTYRLLSITEVPYTKPAAISGQRVL